MIVQVHEGKLRGVEKKSTLSGRPYYAFQGIPYAKPPIGDLRFKPPVPIEKWDGILDASKEGNECIQSGSVNGERTIVGSEDCLFMNVYTPEAPGKVVSKKAVMVFIHGGGYVVGSSSSTVYGPDFLVDYDVILVTFNYRLHVFGFLNAGTPNCPGNAGLKDQLLALKWVKKNIASFGGDPENITLFGESAGSTSVHLQMLSPAAKGLFKRAMAESGNALSAWAIHVDPVLQARKLGELAGYQGDSLEGLVEYLKNLPAKKLAELSAQRLADEQKSAPGDCMHFPFVPSVENIKNGAFLPDLPKELMKSACHIPAVFGCNNQEGMTTLLLQGPEVVDSLLSDLSPVVTDNFNLDESEQADLLAKIKKIYFHNEPATHANIKEFIDLRSDLYWFLKFYEAVDYLVQSETPPYLYLFTYEGKLNFHKRQVEQVFPYLNVKGANHADEMGYLFRMDANPTEIDEADRNVIDHLCTLWTNFAKYGRPTSSSSGLDWKPHTSRDHHYLEIGDKLEVFNKKIFEKRLGFWRNVSSKFKE